MIVNIKLLFFISFLALSLKVSAGNVIETVEDLGELQKQSQASNLPVLLMFTAEDCDYCEAIRKNYLLPMIESGKYAETILFRQLYIEDYNYLRNEKGEFITGDTIAMKYDVEVTPTILFLTSKWQELTERIVGINGVDFFDKSLINHIEQAHNSYARLSKVKK